MDPDPAEPPPADADPSQGTEDPSTGGITTAGPIPVKAFETFYMPIYVMTAVFGIIFIIGPLLVCRSHNKGIIRCCIMMTAFSMWILWVTVYIAQMNPLIGPRVRNHTAAWIAHSWGNPAV